MKPTTLLAAVAVLLLAAFLRFHQLEAQSFWNDEGNSARLSERPIAQIIEGTASDVHPPLYYLLLHAWRAGTGESEFVLRALSALAGVLTVAATMALARAVARSTDAVMVIAGLLAAFSPPLVYYAQETRMYALLALLAVISTWTLWQWLAGSRAIDQRGSWPWLIAYGLSILAGLYTHYFFPAVILAHGLLVALFVVTPSALLLSADQTPERRRRLAVAWAGAVVVAVLGYAVWVPIFLRQIGGRGGVEQGVLAYLQQSGAWLAVGTTLPASQATWALLAGLALVTLGVLIGRRRAVVPLVMALVPIGGSYLAGTTDPAFFKFLLTAVPFLCIVAGLAWQARGWLRAVPAILTILVLTGSWLSLINMATDPLYARADYRGMAARIETEAHPNAAVILNAPNQWEVFTYYHRDGAPVYPIPKGQPDAAVVEPELAEIAATHDRIYALFWGDSQRDPQRVVERWLDNHTFKAAEEWVGDVRFVTYAVPSGAIGEMTSAGYEFLTATGDAIILESYAMGPTALAPGDSVQVQLVWSADTTPEQPYKVFIHLLDASGNLVAQRDSEPAGGSRPMPSWAPGELITDNHGVLVPLGAPSGDYRLVVGLYDPADPSARLPVTVDGVTRDAVPLGTITIRQ